MLSDHCPVCPVCDVGILWSNGCIYQDVTWYGGRPRPRPHWVRWGLSSCPLPQRGTAPNVRPMSVVSKQLDGSRRHLVQRYRRRPRPHCVIWGPITERDTAAPKYGWGLYRRRQAACVQTAALVYRGETVAHFSIC